jgi:hypothetical protein
MTTLATSLVFALVIAGQAEMARDADAAQKK